MLPPVSPIRCLDVGRAEQLVLLDALAHVGRVGLDRVEDQAGDLVAARIPAALVELVGRVLGEGAHHMGRRRDRGVVGGLEVELGESDPGSPRRARLERLLAGVEPAVIVTIARCGSTPPAAVNDGGRLSAAFSLTTGERTSQASRRSR